MSKRSVMSHSFSRNPSVNINRSSFDRSHKHSTTLDSGYLVPVFTDEALPGDTFSIKPHMFGRMATPLHPVMDNIYLDYFFFSVPMRLIWQNWEKFNGAQDNPGDSTDFLVPQMTSPGGGYASESLSTYFGIPRGIASLTHNSHFHRAYNLIYNEWFRDENLQDSVVVDTDDGPDDPADYVLLRRGKRHDYFTSCLPSPQKGDSVDIPLGTTAPVLGVGQVGTSYASGNFYETGATGVQTIGRATASVIEDPNNPGFPGVFADLSSATAATVNQLRQAVTVQHILEKDARGGTRYVEILRNHFGVISPDARIQRPEYLGGGSSPVNMTPIAQTSSTDGTSPQANLAAIGTVSNSGRGIVSSFTEHCVVIGLVSVRADLTYQQGLNRMFSRRTRYDYFLPSTAHIGEQAVLNKEIYAQADANDDLVFGYQERFSEYRYKPSIITGKFASSDPASLDSWILTQDFSSLPVLNDSFIQDNPPISRVISVPSEPQFLLDCYFNFRAVRPVPVYGIPGLSRF